MAAVASQSGSTWPPSPNSTMAASSLQMTRREDGSYLFDFVNHSQQVLFTLNECRQFANLCDCSVVVEGQVFYAHKGVLVSCSDYFKVR